MSASFRPVKETWYEGVDGFVDQDMLLRILEHVADQISSQFQTTNYSDLMVFWVENGRDFIRYVENDEDFAAGDIAHDLDMNLPDDLFSLVSNMKNAAGLWRQALDEDGSLRFYVD